MTREVSERKPIINCHTHIFTGDHVPPYLAKTFLIWPFYYLLHLSLIVNFFRWWYRYPARIKYKWWYKRLVKWRNLITILLNRFGFIKALAGLYITLQVIFILFDWIAGIFPPEQSKILKLFSNAGIWLKDHYLLLIIQNNFLKIFLIVFVFLFVAWGRNLIFFIFKRFWSFLAMLPGKKTKELFRRYLNIGRYAFHKKQTTIFGKLRDQYPDKTGFIILPMDMEYMKAGKVNKRYRDQLSELADLKTKNPEIFFPFLFADPRRMVAPPDKEKSYRKDDKVYFSFTHSKGVVTLSDCLMKDYLEGDNKFNGIKIYPALGYYPFDETLLPLWKYAADNGIPILTHCIRGTIFYRGKKKKEWNRHPVFGQAEGRSNYAPLVLPQMKNVDFSINFTHPLNYLCLLEEILLRKWVGKCNGETKLLFGYTNEETPLKYSLRHLKICFGHYGGDDEWALFFERDRDLHSSQLVKNPEQGLQFLFDEKGDLMKGKPEQIWKDADWYTIISSLMMQYPNVYADISYILHSEEAILALLKQTLAHVKLKEKVLYGTDFYVVRNHKSDKNMLADMMGGLTVEDFDVIARGNPGKFLFNKFPAI